jgi:hypothetical protein
MTALAHIPLAAATLATRVGLAAANQTEVRTQARGANGAEPLSALVTDEQLHGREQKLTEECKALEGEITKRAREFGRSKLVHRWVKLAVGWLAVVAGAMATATAFNDDPEVAAWAALAATILAGWQTWQNPTEKEADHQGREAACQHLERRVRQIRTLRQNPSQYDTRVLELAQASEELKQICERPWIK